MVVVYQHPSFAVARDLFHLLRLHFLCVIALLFPAVLNPVLPPSISLQRRAAPHPRAFEPQKNQCSALNTSKLDAPQQFVFVCVYAHHLTHPTVKSTAISLSILLLLTTRLTLSIAGKVRAIIQIHAGNCPELVQPPHVLTRHILQQRHHARLCLGPLHAS
jgi:hypothetical protein